MNTRNAWSERIFRYVCRNCFWLTHETAMGNLWMPCGFKQVDLSQQSECALLRYCQRTGWKGIEDDHRGTYQIG